MALVKQEERIPARMPKPVYDKISEAANAVGATLNQFLVQSALDRANEILDRERIIDLSSRAAKTVFDLIEHPPKPNAALRKAMRRRET